MLPDGRQEPLLIVNREDSAARHQPWSTCGDGHPAVAPFGRALAGDRQQPVRHARAEVASRVQSRRCGSTDTASAIVVHCDVDACVAVPGLPQPQVEALVAELLTAQAPHFAQRKMQG